MVGLPVTFSCHVEGDPNHYWVGWMHRDQSLPFNKENNTPFLPLGLPEVHVTTSHYILWKNLGSMCARCTPLMVMWIKSHLMILLLKMVWTWNSSCIYTDHLFFCVCRCDRTCSTITYRFIILVDLKQLWFCTECMMYIKFCK